MKKRFLAILFVVVLALGCVFGLAACKDDPKTNNAPPTTISGEWDCWELRRNSDDNGWHGELEFSVTFADGNVKYEGKVYPYTIENGTLAAGNLELKYNNGQWQGPKEGGDPEYEIYVLVEKGKTPEGFDLNLQ